MSKKELEVAFYGQHPFPWTVDGTGYLRDANGAILASERDKQLVINPNASSSVFETTRGGTRDTGIRIALDEDD